MKRFLILSFLTGAFQFTMAQCPIGANETQLRTSLRGRLSALQPSEGSGPYLISQVNYGITTYYLNTDNLVNRCVLLPKDDATTALLTEEFNKRYTSLSETEWKSYLDNGGTMEVKLTWVQKKATFEFKGY